MEQMKHILKEPTISLMSRYDRCSNTKIKEDNQDCFVADDKIDDFINEPYVIDSYVYLICKHYKNSIENRLERPECVVTISKQMSGFNECNEIISRKIMYLHLTKLFNVGLLKVKMIKGFVEWIGSWLNIIL